MSRDATGVLDIFQFLLLLVAPAVFEQDKPITGSIHASKNSSPTVALGVFASPLKRFFSLATLLWTLALPSFQQVALFVGLLSELFFCRNVLWG
jgi:hypothetical protein